ncbi:MULTISPECIES: DinB family protein [unclassified Kitasatospora]|uniref:DinB family protein n=1 Tax=unclassified Kitasatospora TaxID=2633591 RepID=UPI00070FFF0C|nr:MULTISPECIES: DinB family protein [unclassified Kitasatospora]KQV17337.1 mini-circle protein [Kitasatospora sp. Root107]KRB65573.1 mini-circle protein [Kitasatospora sp. Root187]
MTRTDLPPVLDERTSLATFLDYTRATALAKCENLAQEDANKAPLPGSPLMTMAGLISHLRWVEYWWFDVVFLGGEDEGPWTEEDPDREMRIAVDLPLAELLDDYRQLTDRYRELVAATDLDIVAQRTVRDGKQINLRWIILHLIEETARHNGHLDLLRELADGTTGS